LENSDNILLIIRVTGATKTPPLFYIADSRNKGVAVWEPASEMWEPVCRVCELK